MFQYEKLFSKPLLIKNQALNSPTGRLAATSSSFRYSQNTLKLCIQVKYEKTSTFNEFWMSAERLNFEDVKAARVQVEHMSGFSLLEWKRNERNI